MGFNAGDRVVLRDLARQVAEIADSAEMAARIRRWRAHNALRSTYPLMLTFPEGAWCELLPTTALRCQDERARGIEADLRRRLYGHAHFHDDGVVVKDYVVHKHVHSTGWGLEARWIWSRQERGARHFDPVIKEPADLAKLKHPRISWDEAASRQALAEMQELFGDLLTVRLVGVNHLSYHLMAQYTALRGLEEVMMDMLAEPAMLHDAMAFLEAGHHSVLQQYRELNLLEVNNDHTYHSSGGNGYTDELPLPDCDRQRVRPQDMWASAESQELAQVSPEHHAEFVLPYERRLLAPFGLTGYGCCEDLTRKLDDVFTLPRLRRISISPWADVDVCAAKLGGRYLFSWKPNPAHLVGNFDPAAIRAYVRHTVQAARRHGCVLELILKDTHTCEYHPERFDQWTRIARDVIQEEAGPPPMA